MTASLNTSPDLLTPSRLEIRPRYEGSNICTWIGFKHVNYLVEEAVNNHLRSGGLPPGTLYEVYGLCVDIVDIDTRILHAFHIDDVAIAEVKPARKAKDGELLFSVVLQVQRETLLKAVTSTVRVQLRHDPRGGGGEPVPATLAPYAVERLGAVPAWEPGTPDADVNADDLVKELTAGKNAYAWKFRIPYWYCHYTERMQMSGYLRMMEEAKDRFVADRGVSIKTLLDEQNWIPVVPHSRITVLDEARMEEDLYTVFTVEEIFKGITYTSRMDTYVVRDGKLLQTSTGLITHGYAVIENRRDWSLVNFDDRMNAALEGRSA
ncbi:thioesterase family protein [Streptomyces sp. AP-93]|nr:thioesterase family protein [Streptomyces sp. AP-93]MCJ0871746.1 thioesterase family protein [Streptomyces sp. AP-93]